jgi:hypothetical protein
MALKLADMIPGLKNNAAVDLPADITIGGSAVVALATVTSSSANALTAGPTGATNPTFNVDASTGSAASGLNVTAGTAAGTVAVAVISSGSNTGLSVDAKGSGTINIGGTSTGIILMGGGSGSQPVTQGTITDYDSQTATLTMAAIMGGIVTHNSKTGAGAVTLPSGTAMSAGIVGVAVGSTVRWTYYNRGNQTATVTANTDHTIVGGTAAVTTGKVVNAVSVCTATHVWVTYLTTLF